MEVAAKFRTAAARDWVQQMEETCALLGGIVSIINPAQFESGIACIEAIRSHPAKVAKREYLEELLETWTSPYVAFSIMNNRDTPLHRDNKGGYRSMDLLTSVGNYINGRFSMPGLGIEFWYRPGSVIGIAGRVVRHGATAEGERLCIAQYMRENVLKAVNVSEPDWSRIPELPLSSLSSLEK